MQPFMKWIGGKRQLLPILNQNLPEQFNRYFEPFVGGGALFFDLNKPGSYISDTNHEVINAYRVIADERKLPALIALLREHRVANSKEYYIAVRNIDRIEDFVGLDDVQRAARFLFLGKTSFNGLVRVNAAGYNNADYNHKINPRICDLKTLLPCQRLLAATEIQEVGFEEALKHAKGGDFVYMDPPYVRLSPTSSFVSYTKESFGSADQVRLRNVVDDLHSRGVNVMLSNSFSDETVKLYAGYRQITVKARRLVNCMGGKRGAIEELLVTTYRPSMRSDLFV